MPGRRIAAGLVLGAGCLLSGAWAAEGLRSTLISKPELRFDLSESGGGRFHLVHRPTQGDVMPVAVVTTSPGRMTIERFPLPQGTPADVEVATLERLFVLAMRHEPLTRFSFDGQEGYSQDGLQVRLAHERERALKRAGIPGKPWAMVTMAAVRRPNAGGDDVAVRVMHQRRPVVGTPIFFNRAPHFGCSAKTGADGIAACTLRDMHPEEHGHEEHKEPVVATYPGDVRPERALPPTTLVIKAR